MTIATNDRRQTATIEAANQNKFGFPGYLINGKWINGDKKGAPAFNKGDTIEFETYLAKGKYETVKTDSIKRAAAPPAGVAAYVAQGGAAPARQNVTSSYAQKEGYWSDKAVADAAREPRIAYQGAYKIAVAFAELALKNGAFVAFSKAKDSAKLDILTAFVDEQATRIHAQSYAAVAPTGEAVPEESSGLSTDDTAPAAKDEQWS